jgi:hypothetical protein
MVRQGKRHLRIEPANPIRPLKSPGLQVCPCKNSRILRSTIGCCGSMKSKISPGRSGLYVSTREIGPAKRFDRRTGPVACHPGERGRQLHLRARPAHFPSHEGRDTRTGPKTRHEREPWRQADRSARDCTDVRGSIHRPAPSPECVRAGNPARAAEYRPNRAGWRSRTQFRRQPSRS